MKFAAFLAAIDRKEMLSESKLNMVRGVVLTAASKLDGSSEDSDVVLLALRQIRLLIEKGDLELFDLLQDPTINLDPQKKEQYLKQLESYFSLPGATTSPSTGVGGVNFTK